MSADSRRLVVAPASKVKKEEIYIFKSLPRRAYSEVLASFYPSNEITPTK